jgi:hypothetical protein
MGICDVTFLAAVSKNNLSVGSLLSIIILERVFDVPTVQNTQAEEMFWKDDFIE